MTYPDFCILDDGNSKIVTKPVTVQNDFAGWYFSREEYLRVYGEPSDSKVKEFKHEVDCMVMEVARYNGPDARMSEDEIDKCHKLFDGWLEDTSDEAQGNTDAIEFYHKEVNEFSVMNTCLVLGMITGCLNNDNYEEADSIARMYQGRAEHQRHLEWVAFDAERKAGCMELYQPDTHACAVVRLLGLITLNLAGDEPTIDICIGLCDSFYAELLEDMDNG